MDFNFGQRVRVIEPGPNFGKVGTIVRDPDPDTLEEWYDQNLPVRFDDGELLYCHDGWGRFESFLEPVK